MDMTPPHDALVGRPLSTRQFGRSRSIGQILVDAGRISPDAAARIASSQSDQGLRFGEAGVKLNLITLADIEFALARQFEYPYLDPSEKRINQSLVTAFQPFSECAEQLRSLRTRLLMHLVANDTSPRSIAIQGSVRGEGCSFIAANLAVVFSQMGERTLLIDANLRNPSLHQLFGIDAAPGVSEILMGRAGPECIVTVEQFLGLSVLPAGSRAPNPQELLIRSGLSDLLRNAVSRYDVVIVDTPAASTCADAQIVAARCGASVVVARRNVTDARAFRRLQSSLREAAVSLAGVVFNDADQ